MSSFFSDPPGDNWISHFLSDPTVTDVFSGDVQSLNPVQFATPQTAGILAAIFGGSSRAIDFTDTAHFASPQQQQVILPGSGLAHPANAGLLEVQHLNAVADENRFHWDVAAQIKNNPNQMSPYTLTSGPATWGQLTPGFFQP